jgi:hypothetical protein
MVPVGAAIAPEQCGVKPTRFTLDADSEGFHQSPAAAFDERPFSGGGRSPRSLALASRHVAQRSIQISPKVLDGLDTHAQP